MTTFDYSILQCPVTNEGLKFVPTDNINGYVRKAGDVVPSNKTFQEGFVNASGTYFYPVMDDIILLLPAYALFVGEGEDSRGRMAFDKQRVFNYYNEIDYDIKNGYKIYKDSTKWVDYRKVTSPYIRNSFTRAKKYLSTSGKYLLDIASGPIGLEEYLSLSENFEYRICADISINALIQAKLNYGTKKGIYLCADITNIPIRDNICDSVLSQHTLYHIPRKEQKTAVNEMYRVAKPGGKVAIVYSFFYHSWFMNIALFPVQLYRIFRHVAGKIYVRIFNGKPRLYFYPHSRNWFRRSFDYGKNFEFFCWRSTNKIFLNIFIHNGLWGRVILDRLRKSEEKHPKFWGRLGEYPVITLTKE
jgi:ubiquinone/menaquinone biosynthesis C-methylase UbiE